MCIAQAPLPRSEYKGLYDMGGRATRLSIRESSISRKRRDIVGPVMGGNIIDRTPGHVTVPRNLMVKDGKLNYHGRDGCRLSSIRVSQEGY